jgi:tetratricopeptide (TPR) repeat protein
VLSAAHPARRDLEAFVLGRLDPQESLGVLLHLLPGCARCREITAALWRAGRGEPAPAAVAAGYETAVERVRDRVRRANAKLTAERAAAPFLLARLEREPAERRESALRADPRYRTWAFCELLLTQGRARLAAAAAEGLDPAVYPPPVAADLAARCWGEVADARRLAADFRGAEDALGRAAVYLTRGTGDRLALARLLDLKAALRAAEGRCDEAVRLLRRAAALYRRAGQLDSLGRALIRESHVHACAGDPMAAVTALREGLALADFETGREPRLAFAACHSLAFLLDSLGRPAEARTLLAAARPLVDASGDPLDAVRLRHLEARIAAALGESAAAEAALGEVRRIFLAREMGYDAALAALDLAALFAGQGRAAELAALGASMLPLCRARDLHRETVAALLLFQKAACARRATPALVREISGRVLRLRREG